MYISTEAEIFSYFLSLFGRGAGVNAIKLSLPKKP